MKNLVKGMFIGALSAAALVVAAEDKVIFDLNFDNGMESGVYEFSKRGSASLVDEEGKGKVLQCVAEGKKGPAGIILLGDAAPEFTPEAFTLSFKFKYTGKPISADGAKKLYAWLYDCRYRGKGVKGGMNVLISADPKAHYIRVSMGYKDGKSGSFSFKVPATVTDGNWHEVSFTAATPKFTMKLDGKEYNNVMLGVPAPASQRLTIGDCVGSSYGPFPGLFDDVKLTTPAAPAAK